MVKYMANIVYALIDPLTHLPRYVGQTTKGKSRFIGHLFVKNPGHPTHKENWIQKLRKLGLRPALVVLLELPTPDHLGEAEMFWISEMKRRGMDLTNGTEGGDGGALGSKRSSETIERQRRRLLGHPVSPETRAKIAGSLKGRSRRPEDIAKWRKVSLEQRSKLISERLQGIQINTSSTRIRQG